MYNNQMFYPRMMRNNRRGMGFGRRNDRFFGGGFFFPFVLGGLFGSAINNNRPFYYPVYYSPFPTYNNFF